MEQMQIQFMMIVNSGLQQRLVDRLISVLQFHVFTYQTDLHRIRSRALQGKEFLPRLQLRSRADFHTDLTQDHLVHLLALQYQRNLVDRRYVDRLDHGILGHVTEQRHLT